MKKVMLQECSISYTNETVEALMKINHLSFQNDDSRCIAMFI
jgi:hypothetical protein